MLPCGLLEPYKADSRADGRVRCASMLCEALNDCGVKAYVNERADAEEDQNGYD